MRCGLQSLVRLAYSAALPQLSSVLEDLKSAMNFILFDNGFSRRFGIGRCSLFSARRLELQSGFRAVRGFLLLR